MKSGASTSARYRLASQASDSSDSTASRDVPTATVTATATATAIATNSPALDHAPTSRAASSSRRASASTSTLIRPTVSAWHVFLLLLGYRIVNALVLRTLYVPDEYYQSLEPAWQLAFGPRAGAWITWVRWLM